jgi:hypothetical protein
MVDDVELAALLAAMKERRHSLSWCITPDVAWDETDLST